jgi:hypothetical protein
VHARDPPSQTPPPPADGSHGAAHWDRERINPRVGIVCETFPGLRGRTCPTAAAARRGRWRSTSSSSWSPPSPAAPGEPRNRVSTSHTRVTKDPQHKGACPAAREGWSASLCTRRTPNTGTRQGDTRSEGRSLPYSRGVVSISHTQGTHNTGTGNEGGGACKVISLLTPAARE